MFYILLLFNSLAVRALEPPKLLPGERPPGFGWTVLGIQLPLRAYSGEVNAFRFFPGAEFGAGLNFSPRHGAGFLARVSPNELAASPRAPLGCAVLLWQSHRRRENDSWGAGPAWRRWRAGSGLPGERGWTALYRKDFLDAPTAFSITADLTCFPGQCAAGLAFSAGFYF